MYEIGNLVGYENIPPTSTWFLKYYGVAPGAFREQYWGAKMKGIPAFDRLKLRGKMILIYFLAVFLPIALIGGMLILRTQSMEREKLERDIFSQFQRISRNGKFI